MIEDMVEATGSTDAALNLEDKALFPDDRSEII